MGDVNIQFPEDKEIEKEVVKLLSDLIKIDTTNPPGNETKAAEYLFDIFNNEGIESEIIESAENRGNFVARIKGKSPGKRIVIMAHLDVVPADPKEWSVDPFSGTVKDGFVWGRGALDDKGLVAQEAWTMLRLAREGYKPERGELIFIAEADEEKGGTYGAKWLAESRPDLFNVDYLITEGAGIATEIAGKHKYTVEVAQKGVYWTKLIIKGEPGHGSVPKLTDSAIVKAAKIVERIGKYKAPIEVNEIVKNYIFEFSEHDEEIHKFVTSKQIDDDLIQIIAKKNPIIAAQINALVRDTITPTIFKSGYKENVIPGSAEVVFDARLLPGHDFDDLMKHIKEALGEALYSEIAKIEPITQQKSNQSPYKDVEFYKAIEQVLKMLDDKAVVIPFMLTGGTDSRFFREKGVKAYGFQPIPPGDMPVELALRLIHGIDERIPIKSLVFGAKFLYGLVKISF